MPTNPLFPRAVSALQQAAIDEFRATSLGKTVSAMRRASKAGNAHELDRLQRSMRDLARNHAISRELEATSAARALGDVARYAKGGLRQAILDSVLGALGPVGDLLGALLRPGGRRIAELEQELETAANLLEMFGYGVTRPGQVVPATSPPRTGPARPGGSPRTTGTIGPPGPTTSQIVSGAVPGGLPPGAVTTALQQLQDLGFTLQPPGPGQTQPPIIPPRPDAGTTAATRRQRQPTEGMFARHPTRDGMLTTLIGGQRVNIPDTDPLLTGDMILVKSSNVHSIGYIWNGRDPQRGTLKVRFLAKHTGAPSSGRGALYYYHDCPPQMFLAFHRAASKGKWVWDHLRIRGTVSGHQRPYELASLSSDGYVPRKAVRLGDEEWYLRRTVTGQDGNTYRSRLGDQLVRRDGRPDNGRPGRPDNGRPSNGRS